MNAKRQQQVMLDLQSRAKQEKVGNFSKYVKEMYWPKVSLEKRAQLERAKSSLANQPIRRSE